MSQKKSFSEIKISATAKSKSFRMYTQEEIRTRVLLLDGVLYKKGGTNEYHLITADTGWVIAFAVKPDCITVITQMHVHFDYEDRELYTRADSPFEHRKEKVAV